MTILNGLFNFIYMRDNDWPFGSVYCTINNFVAYYTVIASVLTLTAITLDRYRAIIFPLKPKPSRFVIMGAIFAIWVSSALLSLPSILYSRTFSNTRITICLIMWPDGFAHHSLTDYIYNIFFFLITYVVPLTLMAVCYSRMGYHLWGKRTIGEENETLRQNYQKKKKVVKMFGFVVVSFAVCWLPYHIYFLYTYHDKDVVRMAITKHVYLGIYWMAMINTSINPFIYFLMNHKFRNYFIKAFLFLPRLCLGQEFCREAGGVDTPPVTQADRSARNSMRAARTNSQRSTNTTSTRLTNSNRTSMNTVVNGGAVVEECLLSANGGRDISLSAINGSINSNESTSPPTAAQNHEDFVADTEGSKVSIEGSTALSTKSKKHHRLTIPNFVPYQNPISTPRTEAANGTRNNRFKVDKPKLISKDSLEMKPIISSEI